MRRMVWILAGASASLVSATASAADYNDVTSDLSNNNAMPTVLTVTNGSNTITGQTGTQSGVDLDFFTMHVPSGSRLTAINLVSYGGGASGAKSFIGVESGSTFTNPATTVQANMLGYVHFTSTMVGTNILDDMGAGSGSQGFLGSLGPGDYTFWLQENSTPVINYQLNLVLSAAVPALPAPFGTLLGVALGLGGIALLARRRGEPRADAA